MSNSYIGKWEDRFFMFLAGLVIAIILGAVAFGYAVYNKATIESTCGIKITMKQALLFNEKISRCPVKENK